jgi:hypothetical protein
MSDVAAESADAGPAARTDWWLVGAGALLPVVALLAFATGTSAILGSHPAYVVGLVIVTVVGGLIAWWGSRRDPYRSTRLVRVAARTALLLTVGLVASLVWVLRPAAATDVVDVAMQDDALVTVTASSTQIELIPQDPRGVGMVFLPGGLIEPKAYAHLLRPVAEAGFPVVILKPPFGIAFFAQVVAGDLAAARSSEGTWVVAGHSLGGVAAAGAAADDAALAGLVLWASFPGRSLADRSDLAVASIFGSNDTLTTPDDVAASRDDLPPETRFFEIAGAVHSHFGDYGGQPGDGTPGVSRAEAQEQIVAATLEFLEQLAAEPAG